MKSQENKALFKSKGSQVEEEPRRRRGHGGYIERRARKAGGKAVVEWFVESRI